MFTVSHKGSSEPLYRVSDAVTHCLASAVTQNCGTRLKNILSFIFHVSRNSAMWTMLSGSVANSWWSLTPLVHSCLVHMACWPWGNTVLPSWCARDRNFLSSILSSSFLLANKFAFSQVGGFGESYSLGLQVTSLWACVWQIIQIKLIEVENLILTASNTSLHWDPTLYKEKVTDCQLGHDDFPTMTD